VRTPPIEKFHAKKIGPGGRPDRFLSTGWWVQLQKKNCCEKDKLILSSSNTSISVTDTSCSAYLL